MLLHELNTPLSVIKLGIHTTLRRVQFNAEEEARIRRIDAAVNDLNRIIENCVTADKYADNNDFVNYESIEISDFLEDLVENFGLLENVNGGRINVENALLGSGLQYVKTDPNYLKIILVNLLKNALNYSPSLSKVHLRVEEIQFNEIRSIELTVINRLAHDAKPDLSLLFSRYYRSESARKFPGTGLGLWLSQTLADRLGTKIIVLFLDQEIKFSIALPL